MEEPYLLFAVTAFDVVEVSSSSTTSSPVLSLLSRLLWSEREIKTVFTGHSYFGKLAYFLTFFFNKFEVINTELSEGVETF